MKLSIGGLRKLLKLLKLNCFIARLKSQNLAIPGDHGVGGQERERQNINHEGRVQHNY